MMTSVHGPRVSLLILVPERVGTVPLMLIAQNVVVIVTRFFFISYNHLLTFILHHMYKITKHPFTSRITLYIEKFMIEHYHNLHIKIYDRMFHTRVPELGGGRGRSTPLPSDWGGRDEKRLRLPLHHYKVLL